jgi:flagellar hook-associated protein 2
MGLRTGSVTGSITFGGLSSGIPTNEIIDQLLELQRRPINLLEGQKEDFQAKLSILQDLNTKTLSLRTALRNLDNMTNVRLSSSLSATEEFSKFEAASSDATIASATAGSGAAKGSIAIQVDRLASQEREVSQGYTDLTDTVGTGNFRITVGSTVTDIAVDSSNDELEQFVAAINDSDADVRAFIMNDGSSTPYRIVIEGNQSGDSQTLDLAAGTTLSGGTATPSFTETQAAQSARLYLDPGVDQVEVLSTTNTFTDVIPGVTIEAHKVDAATVTIDVDEDTDAIVDAISGFVTTYNDIVSIIGEQADVDPTTNRGGPLIGDSTLITLKRQLSSVIASEIGSGTITSAIQIGIELDASGELSIDEDKLRSKLSSDFDDVRSFFAGSGSFADQLRVIADTFVDPVGGALVTRIQGVNDTIADLDESIADAEERLDTVEQELIRQFAALERIISDLQQQGLFLNQFLLANQAR